MSEILIDKDQAKHVIAELKERGTTWGAGLPEKFTTATGVETLEKVAADVGQALTLARFATAARAAGPVRPPKELRTAMDRVRALSDGLELLGANGVTTEWERDRGAVGPALVKAGKALYRETAAFLVSLATAMERGGAAAVGASDAPSKKGGAGLSLDNPLVLLGGLYLLTRGGKGKRGGLF